MADETVEQLQKELADRKEYLSDLRAEVQAEVDKAQNGILAAQLRAELQTVEQQISVEEESLRLQRAQNYEQVGAGVEPESPLPVPEAPEPPTESASPVEDVPPTPDTSTHDNLRGDDDEEGNV